MQAEAYAAVGKRLVKDWRAEYRDVLKRILDEMVSHEPEKAAEVRDSLEKHVEECFSRPMPTPYEDPMEYQIVLSLMESVEKAAARGGKSLPLRPLIGTLPYESVNAMAISVARGEYIVVFQDQLFNFANLFAKAIALALPFRGQTDDRLEFSVDPDEIAAQLQSDSLPVRRFSELILAYMLEGAPGAAPQYVLGPPHSFAAAMLREGMEIFVMAHEYGHITEGHLDQAERKDAPRTAGGDEQELLWNWKQETEADVIGLQLTLSAFASDGYDLPMSYWAADLALLSFEIVEKALAVGHGAEEDAAPDMSSTHPPAALRREILRQVLQRSVPSEIYDSAAQLRQNSELIVAALWKHTKEHLRSAITSGAQLAPMWTLKMTQT